MASRQPDKVLSFRDVDSMSVACVYAWKRENDYLYIGSTENLLQRISNHHIIGKADQFRSTDSIEIWITSEDDLGIDLEYTLIQEFRPKYNTVVDPRNMGVPRKVCRIKCLICGKRFKQKRWWQKRCKPNCKRAPWK